MTDNQTEVFVMHGSFGLRGTTLGSIAPGDGSLVQGVPDLSLIHIFGKFGVLRLADNAVTNAVFLSGEDVKNIPLFVSCLLYTST